jgi:hypothetical protein
MDCALEMRLLFIIVVVMRVVVQELRIYQTSFDSRLIFFPCLLVQ